MNVPVTTRGAEGFARRAFTVQEIRQMVSAGVISEEENFELIEGEVVPMSPKGNHHEVFKSALTRILARQAPEDLRLGIETSVYLSERTFVEPDLCLYPKRLLPEDVQGSDLLLVIEVAGSSLGYDKGLKAKLYARYGVPEFWVIDATRRVAWIHIGPQPDGGWSRIEEGGAREPLETPSLPGISILLKDLD